MGCGGSKSDADPEKIKTVMKPVGIADVDSFFENASEVLKSLEEIRAPIAESRGDMTDLGRIEELKDPNMKEAFKVFVWAVSAQKNGKIADADISIDPETLKLEVKAGGLGADTEKFYEAVKSLLAGLVAGPPKFIELGEKLKSLFEEAPKQIESVKGAELDPFAMAKAVANAAINIKTVANGFTKGMSAMKQITDAVVDIKNVLGSIGGQLKTADEVGKKAVEAKLTTMSEIFDKYQDAPRKAKADLEALKKKKLAAAAKKKTAETKSGGSSPTKAKAEAEDEE